MKNKKVIVISKKYLLDIAYRFHDIEVPYRIMSIDKDGKLKTDNISEQIADLEYSIKRSKEHVHDCKKFIKQEEEDMVHEKSLVKYWRNKLRKLKKNEK